METEVQSSFNHNCHHQVNLQKYNLPFLYLPKPVWYYEKVDTKGLLINLIGLEPSLMLMQMRKFPIQAKHCLIYLLYNFIPCDAIVCDDRDSLWLNKEIKNLMVEKNKAYKSHLRVNKSIFLFEKFRALQNQLNTSIEDSKEKVLF